MTDLRIPPIKTAVEIAALVQMIPIEDGAALIEQYARCVAAEARCDATDAAYEKWDAMFRDFMRPRQSPEEFAETLDKVAKEMSDV